jgi:hypothetical protein
VKHIDTRPTNFHCYADVGCTVSITGAPRQCRAHDGDTLFVFLVPFEIQSNVAQGNSFVPKTFTVRAGRSSTVVKEIDYLGACEAGTDISDLSKCCALPICQRLQ